MVDLLKENEVALKLSISLASLRRWRTEGRGPRFLKLGSSVRYRAIDIEAWLSSCPAGGQKGTET
jgi:predicted DNA-binding transcriptional regulator AlpA